MAHATTAELHLLPQTVGVNGIVTTEEMAVLYDQRMANKGSPARRIYDAIKLLPEQGICPLCYYRPVSTLDHVLPKRRYPVLAVNPDNLVGACADCNKLKLDFAPTAANEVPVHPYFDDTSEERWLDAQVVEGPVAAVVFRAMAVDTWSPILNERVRRQFNRLGLAKLYGAQAAREISGIARLLGDIFGNLGANGVRVELQRQAMTREAARLNSWQAVTFRNLVRAIGSVVAGSGGTNTSGFYNGC